MADARDRFNQTAEAITDEFFGHLETEPAPHAIIHYIDKKDWKAFYRTALYGSVTSLR